MLSVFWLHAEYKLKTTRIMFHLAVFVSGLHGHHRERERELRREGGKSLLAYVKGAGPYLI